MRFADDVSNLSGTADVSSFTVTAALPAANSSSSPSLAGSFSAASSGRFPLTLTVAPASGRPAPEFTTSNPACYIVDTNTPISWSGRHHTPQRCHATAEERPLRNDTLVRSAIALRGTALTACIRRGAMIARHFRRRLTLGVALACVLLLPAVCSTQQPERIVLAKAPPIDMPVSDRCPCFGIPPANRAVGTLLHHDRRGQSRLFTIIFGG
jgi:hypothetical protein